MFLQSPEKKKKIQFRKTPEKVPSKFYNYSKSVKHTSYLQQDTFFFAPHILHRILYYKHPAPAPKYETIVCCRYLVEETEALSKRKKFDNRMKTILQSILLLHNTNSKITNIFQVEKKILL